MSERDAPIVRVANVILETSIKEDAATITGELQAKGDVSVKYRIGDKWHDRMKIPHYVWKPLRDEFARRAGLELGDTASGSGNVEFPWGGQSYRFRISVEPERISLERTAAE